MNTSRPSDPPGQPPGEPPVDPRSSWDLPRPGEMPRVSVLDELVTRVLAPNPSPMTLDGTNTYVIAPAGSGDAVVVDPGPEEPEHLARVEEVLSDADAQVRSIVVTHHHLDHAAAAAGWATRFGCPVVASTVDVAGPGGRIVADGDRVAAGPLHLDVVATPGHTRDHVALRLPSGALLTGDHVLGRGTSVVAYPDGDLTAYLESLRRVLALGPDQLFPGHGPELTEDPQAVLRYYAEHRGFREAQILAILARGPATPRQIVEDVYREVDRRLWDAAEASTRAALASLEERGVLAFGDDGHAALLHPGG
jgi:glyoxylase-like metal-dependent hydrolase (beta-lactamase superfamily II)